MPVIYSFPTKTNPVSSDLLLLSDVENSNRTRKITIGDLKDPLDVVDRLTAGPGISISNPTGDITIGNTGVLLLNSLKGDIDIVNGVNTTVSVSGQNISINIPADTVTGTGTPDTLTKWNAAGTGIEDSPISKITDSIKVSDSLMIGASNTISGAFSQAKFASGENNTVSGDVSTAIGFNNNVAGIRGGALGANNVVVGAQTWVIGEGNDVGSAAANEGDNNIVSGQGNTVRSGTSGVIGKDNTITSTASENRNFILGFSNALNDVSDSIAVGGGNTINDNKSYIFGEGNTTSQNDTYAVGKNNTLSSEDDYAFGLNNTLSGNANIAMALGHENVLSGSQSYAFGRTLADGGEDNTVIIGRYNATPTATGRIVFGTGFSNAGRKNALEIQAGNNSQSGILFPAIRLSNTYNNDAEATIGGVEEGELYRANNEIRINLKLAAQDARNNEGFNILTPEVRTFTNNSSLVSSKFYNLVQASWSGNQGSATLTLPTALEMINRNIKIVTDETFTGSTLTITTASSIDGQSTLVITNGYQSVNLWSNGTEWFTLT